MLKLVTRRVPQSHVLTKSPGGLVTASWVVTNTGGSTGQARINIASGGSLVFIGPAINILPGAIVALTGTWTIPAGATGTLSADANIVDVGLARVIATHPFTVTILQTFTKAQLLAEAQGYASGIPCPDTKFWVGSTLVLHNLINDPFPQDYVDSQPGTSLCSGFTWDLAWDFWMTSGKVFTDRIVG